MTLAYLRHLVLCVLKEYRVPLVDPCDPTYQGIDCGISFTPGTCTAANACMVSSFNLVDLIQGNTPPGNFQDGMVTLELKISSLSNNNTTFVSDGQTKNVGTYYPYEEMDTVDLTSIGNNVIVTWEYRIMYVSSTNVIENMIGPCTLNIINNASAGQPGAITIC